MTPEQIEIVRQEFEKHMAKEKLPIEREGEVYLDPTVDHYWTGYKVGVGDIFATSRIVAVTQSRIVALENFVRFVLDGLQHKAIKAKPFITPDNQVGNLKDMALSLLK